MAKPAVKANVFTDKDGDTLATKDVAGIVAAYRERADLQNEEADSTAGINDDRIWAIISAIKGGTEADEARINALLEADPDEEAKDAAASEVPPTDSVVAASDNVRVIDVAQRLGKSREFAAEIEALCAAKERMTLGPVAVAEMWAGAVVSTDNPIDKAYADKAHKPVADFGKDHAEALAYVNSWPETGTTGSKEEADKSKGKLRYSNNPEIWKSSVTSEGKTKWQTRRFYREILFTLPFGRVWNDRLSYLRSEEGKSALGKNNRNRLGEVNRLNGKINTATNVIRRARRFCQQWSDVQAIPESKIRVLLQRAIDEKGNLTHELSKASENIYVYDANNMGGGELVSLTTFLSWQPKKCKPGATLAALKDTAKRGTKKTTGQNAGPAGKVSVDDSTIVLGSLVGGFEVEDWRTAFLRKLRGEGGKALMENAYDLRQWLNYCFNPDINADIAQAAAAMEQDRKTKAKPKAA